MHVIRSYLTQLLPKTWQVNFAAYRNFLMDILHWFNISLHVTDALLYYHLDFDERPVATEPILPPSIAFWVASESYKLCQPSSPQRTTIHSTCWPLENIFTLSWLNSMPPFLLHSFNLPCFLEPQLASPSPRVYFLAKVVPHFPITNPWVSTILFILNRDGLIDSQRQSRYGCYERDRRGRGGGFGDIMWLHDRNWCRKAMPRKTSSGI